MFDFIPIQFYTPIYYHVLLVFILVTFFHTQITAINSQLNLRYIKIAGVALFLFVLLYMGLRPIHGVFVDMTTYNRGFQRYAAGGEIRSEKDLFFHIFTQSSAKIMNAQTYFLVCASIYVIPLYVVSVKWFKRYWFYAFLLLVGSFTFWAFGTNGIRNGMAGSLFLLGISRDRRIFQVLILILALNFHKSLALPIAGFIITQFYNQPRGFYYFWLLCIPLSLAFPGLWENLLASLVEDERSEYLTKEVEEGRFSQTGFRWDFLIYGATGVIAGWYYIFKKKIDDVFYIRLYNIFLFANAFWILVIRANFSNRFAYLSWFLLALVIVYPWGKYYFEKDQHKKLGWIMLAYFGFTYFMNVI